MRLKIRNLYTTYALYLFKQPTLQLAGDDKEENNFQYAQKIMSLVIWIW